MTTIAEKEAQRRKLLEMVEEQEELGGRFTNIRRLSDRGGNGAFSLVFRAQDRDQNGRPVALKFIDPFEKWEYRVRCFQREPVMLQHFVGQRDIIQLVAGMSEFTYTLQPLGFPIPFSFYAVELADSDLASLIESGALSLRECLLHLRTMFRAVQRIHSSWAAHRDIKPANFLRMADGSLKLSDFGTARFVADDYPAILPDYAGIPPGDYGYTAPEIFASIHDADPRIALKADIFALGSCAFEMFTGIPLGVQLFDEQFQDDFVRVMAEVRRADRQRIYDQIIGSIADSRPLPSIAAFVPNIPAGIVPAIDDFTAVRLEVEENQLVGVFGEIGVLFDGLKGA